MHIKELHTLFIKSSGVTIDSKKVKLNNIFFALKRQEF